MQNDTGDEGDTMPAGRLNPILINLHPCVALQLLQRLSMPQTPVQLAARTILMLLADKPTPMRVIRTIEIDCEPPRGWPNGFNDGVWLQHVGTALKALRSPNPRRALGL